MAIRPIATAPTSRRALLAGLAGGIAAAVAASLGRAQPVAAHDTDDVRLGGSNSATSLTIITNTGSNGDAFAGHASGSGFGVFGSSSSGNGVGGFSVAGSGVSGSSSGMGNGVFGSSNSGTAVNAFSTSGTAVSGFSDSGTAVRGTSRSSTGVSGISDSGFGLDGFSISNSLPAVLAVSGGGNTGLQAYSGPNNPPASPAKTGVQGFADKDAGSVGVRGASPAGRGGVFKGGAAQLKLVASSSTTHPSSGQLGDLFLDKNKRLWFCRGGATWKQLA